MKIRETHRNGTQIEVTGIFRVVETVKAWREHQESTMEPPKSPRPVGFQPEPIPEHLDNFDVKEVPKSV